MDVFPLEYVGQGPLGEVSVHLPRRNLHGDLKVSVDCVKVRRVVIAVVHRDDDPEEAAEFWHATV